VGEPFRKTQSPAVFSLGIFPEGVLVDRDEGVRKRRCLAYMEPFVVCESTLTQQRRVLRPNERKMNSCGNHRILGKETQRDGA
jgi:hypothetical protein